MNNGPDRHVFLAKHAIDGYRQSFVIVYGPQAKIVVNLGKMVTVSSFAIKLKSPFTILGKYISITGPLDSNQMLNELVV